MIYGSISRPDSYQFLLSHPVWAEAFEWVRNLKPDIAPGIYRLRGDDMYVNVHGYQTLPPEECRYESHRQILDLQYCIRGGELIDWHPAESLAPDVAYDVERDIQFYHSAVSHTSLELCPGRFAIFFPSDGHRPKQSDRVNPEVFKLVVKIRTALL